jgi:hypothetical protein
MQTSNAHCNECPQLFRVLYCGCVRVQASNALPFLQCFVPLLRLLGDQQVKTSTLQQYTLQIYATMYNCVDHARAAAVLKGLAAPTAGDPFAAASSTAASLR